MCEGLAIAFATTAATTAGGCAEQAECGNHVEGDIEAEYVGRNEYVFGWRVRFGGGVETQQQKRSIRE